MHSSGPRYPPAYHPDFDVARTEQGLTGRPFDYFFLAVEHVIGNYPYADSVEVPESDGIRMRATRDAFPDLPPLYLYYKIEHDPNRVVFMSLSAAWSESDLPTGG